MKDELDLTQFKDLVGEVGQQSGGFSIDDILKENFNQPEIEEPEITEEYSEQETDESEEIIEPEEYTEPAEEEYTAETEYGTVSEIVPEQPEDDGEEQSAEQTENESQPKKKHFWDSWIIPADEEETEESTEESESEEEKPEDTEGEPGFLDRMFGIVYDEELDSIPEDKEDKFEEKKPKRHFWEKWLTPDRIEEDEISEDEPEQISEKIPEELNDDIPELEEPEEIYEPEQISEKIPEELNDDIPELEEPEEIYEPEQPEEVQIEEKLTEPEEEPAEIAEDSDAEEIETAEEKEPAEQEQTIIESAEDNASEEQITDDTEKTQTVREETQEIQPDKTEEISAAKSKKPEFLSKWFTPIEDDSDKEQTKAEPAEDKQTIPDNNDNTKGEEKQDDTVQLPKIEEVPKEEEPIISEQEFEAFMKENDKKPEYMSFEDIIGQSEEKEEKTEQSEPTAEKGDIVRNEQEKMETQMVYVDLSRKKSEKKRTEIKEEKSEPHISKYKAREIPKPKWIDMSIEEISRIAPKTVRTNNEPVLMNEVHRLEQERLKRKSAENTAAVSVKLPENQPQQSDKSQTEDSEDDTSCGG